MRNHYIKTWIATAIMAAAIIVGLIPEDPAGPARNIGNAAWWGLCLVSWGMILGSWKKVKWETKGAPEPDARAKSNMVSAVILSLLLAAAGHYILALLWFLAVCLDQIGRLERADEEDAETRPG